MHNSSNGKSKVLQIEQVAWEEPIRFKSEENLFFMSLYNKWTDDQTKGADLRVMIRDHWVSSSLFLIGRVNNGATALLDMFGCIALSDQLTDQFFDTSEDKKMDQLTEVQNLMTLV